MGYAVPRAAAPVTPNWMPYVGGGPGPAPSPAAVSGGDQLGQPHEVAPPSAVTGVSGGGPSGGCGCCQAGAALVQPNIQAPVQQWPAPQRPSSVAPQSPLPDVYPVVPNTDNGQLRQRVTQLAAMEVGTREQGQNRGQRITRYRTAVTGPGKDPNAPEPWCADFVSWIFRQAGAPLGHGGRGDDYTITMQKWAREAGRYRTASQHVPQPGDVAFYDWEGDGAVDHINIVESVQDGHMVTIGGNESDSVRRHVRDMRSSTIVGFMSAD